MADLIGQKLGQYEITAKLGSGGMANVYRARQESMGREVAIKVIQLKLAENPEFIKRFGREARTIAALNHPHILKVFDFGQQDDLLYLVMELQPGGSLADLILKGPLRVEETARLLEQITSALDYAHEQGIVHRDLKPQNVLLDTKGNASLTDFGIAKVLNEATALTVSGTAMGTPSYMSPEQWQSLPLDNRADVYALGIMLFEMLSGKLPFNADTPFGMMHQHINQPPPLIRAYRPDLPPAVEAVVNKALAKNREQRFQSAGEMFRAFKDALTGKANELLPEKTTSAALPSAVVVPAAPRGGCRIALLGAVGLIVVLALAIIGILALAPALLGNPGATPTLATPGSAIPTGVAAVPTLPGPPTLTQTPPATGTGAAIITPTPTATATLMLNLATRAAATVAMRETGTANAFASYTRTPTPNEEQTLAAIVDATETAKAVASRTRTFTNTPTWTPSKTPTATFSPTFSPTVPPPSTPTPTPTRIPPTPTPTSAPQGGELTIWVSGGHEVRVQAAGQAFSARYGVNVNVQVMGWSDLQNRFITWAPGTGPDIVEASNDWLSYIYTQDVLAEINLGNKAVEFDPVTLQAFTHDGKLYGVPYDLNAVALYYNKDLIPNPPKTWDELKSLAKKLQDEKKVDQGFAFTSAPDDAYSTYTLLTGFGGYAFGRDKNGNYDPNQLGIDSVGSIRAATELDSMIKAGLLRSNMDYTTARDMFTAGKLAMWINGPWEMNTIRGSGIRYGITLIPSMPQTPRLFISSDGFVLSKFSQNARLAQQFLMEFLATPDGMKTLYDAQFMVPAYLPTRHAVTGPDIEAFVVSAASGDLIPVIPALEFYWAEVGHAFTTIYQQADTPENAMKGAANAMRGQIAGLAVPQGGELTIWANNGQESRLQAAGMKFTRQSGVTVHVKAVDWNAVKDNFLGDPSAGPDIIALPSDWLAEAYAKDLLAEIDLGDKVNDFDPLALQAFTHEGKLYGVPYGTTAVVLYYNKDLVPNPPKTWEELKSLAKKLQDEKKVDQGFAFTWAPDDSYSTYTLLTGFGGYVFARDNKGNFDPGQVGIDGTGSIRAATELDSMIKTGLLRSNMDYATAQAMFLAGKLAMWVNGPWEMNSIRDSGRRYGVVPVPAMSQTARPWVTSDGLVLNKFSKNAQLARWFMTEFMVTTDAMKTLYQTQFLLPAYLPTRREVADPDTAAFQAAAAAGDVVPAIPAWAAYSEHVSNAFTVIYRQADTPENAMKGAANAMREQIARLGIPASASPTPTLAPQGGALTIWADDGREGCIQAAGQQFEHETGVTVNVRGVDWNADKGKFMNDASAGPDMMVLASDWIADAYAKGMLAEINLGDKARDFDPAALQSFMLDGKLYGLPYDVNAVALYYNKDLIPNPPKTWDELKSIAKKLQDEKKVEQGFAFMQVGDAYGTYPILSGFGGYIFGRDKNGNYDPNQMGIDSPGAIRGATELDSMIKAGLLRDGIDYNTARDMFTKGKLAMWISGPWELNNVRASGIRYGIVPVPPMMQAARPLVGSDGFVSNRLSKNAQLVQRFLTEFLVRPDVMKTFYTAQCLIPAYLPTRREVADPDIAVFQSAAASGDPIPAIPAQEFYWADVGTALTVIYRQADTPENAMKAAGNAMREQIARLGK